MPDTVKAVPFKVRSGCYRTTYVCTNCGTHGTVEPTQETLLSDLDCAVCKCKGRLSHQLRPTHRAPVDISVHLDSKQIAEAVARQADEAQARS
jgi:hypothetical protein